MPVTVPGTGKSTVTLTALSGDVLGLAANIGAYLKGLNTQSLQVTTFTAGASNVSAPSLGPHPFNQTQYLLVSGPGDGQIFIPSGYTYAALDTLVPETVSASGGNLVANDVGDTFQLAGSTTVAVTGGNSTINETSGAGQSFLISSGISGNDTINASGYGTIATGTGDNIITASGNVSIQSGGHDVINLGAGNSTVLSTGNGASLFATDSGAGTTTISATFSGASALVEAWGSDLTALLSGSNASLWGGSGGQLNLDVSGSGAYIASYGSNLNLTVEASAAAPTIFGTFAGSPTNINADIAGSNAFVFAGLSSGSLTLSGSQAEVWGGASTIVGTLNITANSANDTISGQSDALNVTATSGSSGLLVKAGSGPLNFVGSTNAATVYGGSANSNVTVGSGGVYFASGGNDAVTNNSVGVATLFGSSGNALSVQGSGSVLYSAQAGNESLMGFSAGGSDTLYAGMDTVIAHKFVVANDYIQGGSGSNLFLAGNGSDTFASAGTSDTYDFQAIRTNGAADFVQNWSNTDSVNFWGYDSTKSTLTTSTVGSVPTTTLTLSDNTTITFRGVTAADLAQHLSYY